MEWIGEWRLSGGADQQSEQNERLWVSCSLPPLHLSHLRVRCYAFNLFIYGVIEGVYSGGIWLPGFSYIPENRTHLPRCTIHRSGPLWTPERHKAEPPGKSVSETWDPGVWGLSMLGGAKMTESYSRQIVLPLVLSWAGRLVGDQYKIDEHRFEKQFWNLH